MYDPPPAAHPALAAALTTLVNKPPPPLLLSEIEIDSEADFSGNSSYISESVLNPPSPSPSPQVYGQADFSGDTSFRRLTDQQRQQIQEKGRSWYRRWYRTDISLLKQLFNDT